MDEMLRFKMGRNVPPTNYELLIRKFIDGSTGYFNTIYLAIDQFLMRLFIMEVTRLL